EEAGGEAIIARGPNEALAQLHQFMVSAAVIDPQEHALISELQLRRIRVVLKAGTTGEVLARLAMSASNDKGSIQRGRGHWRQLGHGVRLSHVKSSGARAFPGPVCVDR